MKENSLVASHKPDPRMSTGLVRAFQYGTSTSWVSTQSFRHSMVEENKVKSGASSGQYFCGAGDAYNTSDNIHLSSGQGVAKSRNTKPYIFPGRILLATVRPQQPRGATPCGDGSLGTIATLQYSRFRVILTGIVKVRTIVLCCMHSMPLCARI